MERSTYRRTQNSTTKAVCTTRYSDYRRSKVCFRALGPEVICPFGQQIIFQRLFDCLNQRQLVLTTNKRLGSVSKNCEPGDSVCILFGSSIPVILRTVTDPSRWNFLGDSYINVVMEGRAEEDYKKGVFKEQQFSIV